jgi:2-aminoadipate transaminase
MQALHEALEAQGLRPLGWDWKVPTGGLYLWLSGPKALDTGMASEFCRACIDAGVLYVPGDLCFGDSPPRNFVRLSFGVLGEADLREAARRFVQVARRFAE